MGLNAEPVIHFIVPFSQDARFIGGDQNRKILSEKLESCSASGHRRLAIHGLGGVGYVPSRISDGPFETDKLTLCRKTQDVLDFIYQYKDSTVGVFWVHGGSITKFERKLAEILELPSHNDLKEDICPFVKQWFESPSSNDCSYPLRGPFSSLLGVSILRVFHANS